MMSQELYVIWSEEHQAWWAPARNGYTRSLVVAGRYFENEAREIVAEANKYVTPGQFNEVAIVDPIE